MLKEFLEKEKGMKEEAFIYNSIMQEIERIRNKVVSKFANINHDFRASIFYSFLK